MWNLHVKSYFTLRVFFSWIRNNFIVPTGNWYTVGVNLMLQYRTLVPGLVQSSLLSWKVANSLFDVSDPRAVDNLPPGESTLGSNEPEEDVVVSSELGVTCVQGHKLPGEAVVRGVGVHNQKLHEFLVTVVIVSMTIVIFELLVQVVAAAVRLVIVGIEVICFVTVGCLKVRKKKKFL